ncbi:MAG: alpha/beta hydrolase [Burkholderiaceae bacterium]|jgi:pimeloyl-ACP methyl ester carboxylesterase|nr:alpha/beta hydrolase [Burkholderiaceae bacterium]
MKRLLRALGYALATLLVVGGSALALTYAPDRPPEALMTRWAPAPSQLLALQGMAVHMRDVGPRDDPLPIVLLHGTAASLHTWDGWAAALAPTRRVITVDLPGFGLTGPEPRGDYRIERYVRFLVGLLDALGVKRCVLGGNSLGGEIAWNTALAAPERVERLILVDAVGYPLDFFDLPLGFQIALIPGLNRLTEISLPRPLVAASVRDVYGDAARVTADAVDRYYELALRAGNRRALTQRLRQADNADRSERIRAVAQPTLILWGGRDRLIPPAHGERFARDIRASRHVRFDGLGHVPQEEDPARTVAEVKRFLGL